jgi:predicted alpha/beta-fold hydrolase
MIDETTPCYKPPFGLSNRHLQNILSSSHLRRALLLKRHANVLRRSHVITLDCGQSVKLMGELNEQPSGKSKGLVVLMHGWEGSSQSGYMISATGALLQAGFDVFRLNFRDHGDTHHLNRGLFHSALQEEVIGAVKAIQQRWHKKSHYFLAGFSLGGNFALRVALKEQCLPEPLTHVFAVCPVLDPVESMQAMENSRHLYERYFVRKWKRSLLKKLAAFGSYDYGGPLAKMRRLRDMNEYFIPRHTPMKTLEQYFAAYTLTDGRLNGLKAPSTLLFSMDDPIIPEQDIYKLPQLPNLHVDVAARGGHCAFLNTYSLSSWADKRMVATLLASRASTSRSESNRDAANTSDFEENVEETA